MLESFTNVDVSRELVDASDGSCESASGLVHSRTSEEGSFSRRLKVEKNHNHKLDQYVYVEIGVSGLDSNLEFLFEMGHNKRIQ